MPIKVSDSLPAIEILNNENIFVITETRALTQDIRPLEIVVLNLMPTKIETETQLLRVLGNTPLQINVQFINTKTHESKNTSKSHIETFYKTFDDIKDSKFDGMIITGAPVEKMEFEEVDYWEELCEIFEWSKTNVYSTFNICWGAQASLYYRYGVKKYPSEKKVFGIFPHRALDAFHPLIRGLDDIFYVPHSRHTVLKMSDIAKVKDLQVISYSEQAGIHILSDMDCRNFFITGHSEYDRDTLKKEYLRDVNAGLEIDIPVNYFPDDNPDNTPVVTWRSTANLIFSNWLNYFVYQKTPYDLSNL